jgi:cell division protein FtsI (penicillin-binding protein 3)
LSFKNRALNLFKVGPEHHSVIRQALDIAKTRLLVASFCIIFGFGLVAARLVTVTCFHGGQDLYMARGGDPNGVHMGRATFVDRNGEVLATTIATSSLYANPKKMLNLEEAAAKLKTVFPSINQKELLTKLKGDKTFLWVARHLTPQQRASVIRLGLPGLEFMRDTKRVYPYGQLVSHAVGFVDVDNTGTSGLEKGLDEQLRRSNEPVVLSIDIRLQHILFDEIHKAVDRFSATGGSGMMMDIMTGEILAMVSLPDFDPNKPVIEDPQALFNRNTLGVYEMGSSMKIVNTAMALQTGAVDLNMKFDATQPLKVGRHFVTDFHAKNTWLSVSEIFLYSSNIGSARMAMKVGGDRQQAFMKDIGFLQPQKLELPEVASPLVPQKWREANTITISYGYGLSVSPLHSALAVGGIANGGKMVEKATLLKRKPEETTYKQIVSPQVSAKVLDLMQQNVKNGTNTKAQVPGIIVGGKTGTVNQRRAHGRGYQSKAVNTTFVCVFPEKPRYLVFVMLDGPKANKETYGYNTAGWNSAPLAGKVIKRAAPILGINPKFDKEDNKSNMPMLRHANLSRE